MVSAASFVGRQSLFEFLKYNQPLMNEGKKELGVKSIQLSALVVLAVVIEPKYLPIASLGA
jgi:hypothetical protein